MPRTLRQKATHLIIKDYAHLIIMKSDIHTLISALRILSNEIWSDDGVANAVVLEAANRLQELHDENKSLKDIIEIHKGNK